MTELVEYLVKKLVDQPGAVSVTAFEDEQGTIYEVRVAPTDMGKVIGRGGRVANAIRTVVKSVALRDGVNVQVEIMEPEDAAAPTAGEPDGADSQATG